MVCRAGGVTAVPEPRTRPEPSLAQPSGAGLGLEHPPRAELRPCAPAEPPRGVPAAPSSLSPHCDHANPNIFPSICGIFILKTSQGVTTPAPPAAQGEWHCPVPKPHLPCALCWCLALLPSQERVPGEMTPNQGVFATSGALARSKSPGGELGCVWGGKSAQQEK